MSFKKISGYVINLKSILGKGAYGQVYKGQQQSTKLQVAIKVLDKKLINSDEYLKDAIFQEIQILQQVKCKNIVGVFDVMESSNNYYIVQQLCDSDLEKYLEANPNTSEAKAIEILKQIINGFISLVKEGIIHRDVKPANILISKGQMKIGDFGFAKKNCSKKMKLQTSVGTPLYMSLQMLKGEKYTSKCDIWAVGFIFYELLHGYTPYTAKSSYQLAKNIESKKITINPNLNAKTISFLRKVLAVEEKDRYQWDQVFMDPIFDGEFNIYQENNKKIENKLKLVMSTLRFKINSENIDVQRLFQILGFNKNSQLNFKEFHKFLDYLSPKITQQEVKYFFDKIDIDGSGTVSISEIQTEMQQHNIKVNTTSKLKKANSINSNLSEPMQLSTILSQKTKKCFQRLYRVLTYKKISLKKTFKAYDKEKNGFLTFDAFKGMINKLDNTFTEEDIQTIFDFIDQDKSNSIQFSQLNTYYSKVNGLPQNLDANSNFISDKQI